jgi:hypothetical protein
MSVSLERLARNQVLFREVNERLRSLSGSQRASSRDGRRLGSSDRVSLRVQQP